MHVSSFCESPKTQQLMLAVGQSFSPSPSSAVFLVTWSICCFFLCDSWQDHYGADVCWNQNQKSTYTKVSTRLFLMFSAFERLTLHCTHACFYITKCTCCIDIIYLYTYSWSFWKSFIYREQGLCITPREPWSLPICPSKLSKPLDVEASPAADAASTTETNKHPSFLVVVKNQTNCW